MSAAGSGGFSREFALFSVEMILFWLILGEGGNFVGFFAENRGKMEEFYCWGRRGNWRILGCKCGYT